LPQAILRETFVAQGQRRADPEFFEPWFFCVISIFSRSGKGILRCGIGQSERVGGGNKKSLPRSVYPIDGRLVRSMIRNVGRFKLNIE
jgi:hypothetical protein